MPETPLIKPPEINFYEITPLLEPPKLNLTKNKYFNGFSLKANFFCNQKRPKIFLRVPQKRGQKCQSFFCDNPNCITCVQPTLWLHLCVPDRALNDDYLCLWLRTSNTFSGNKTKFTGHWKTRNFAAGANSSKHEVIITMKAGGMSNN